MKLIPKPEGFEMRDKRAERKDASHWTPGDALYDAQQMMAKSGMSGAVLVAWLAPCDCDNCKKPGAVVGTKMRYRSACESDIHGAALAAKLIARMMEIV